MASKALFTPEQYLATHFEREPEYVHGELVERSLPKKKHGRTQLRLCVLLGSAGFGCTELRVKLAEDLYRIPDFILYESEPDGDPPPAPPLLVVEIYSPDDRMRDVTQKLEDYRAWGAQNIWLVDPYARKVHLFDGALREVDHLALLQFHLTVSPADLFD
ncbi:MAG TPA: Uma2 family endonuclease [Bryobacteraceae bacterium]|nr:Uma2 family endonuclease [Bryobacteraceae bacterium]